MKKVFTLLLVVAFLGPWLGLICSCCPMAHAAPTQQTEIGRTPCDCCPDPLQIEEKKLAVQNFGIFLFSQLSKLISIGFTANLFSPVSTTVSPIAFRDTGPPSSSNTPLYLTHQILLI